METSSVEDVAVVDGFAALASIPAGPRLAAALARIDVTHVPNNELLALLAAQSRQANHEAARLLGVIAEIGRATPTFDDDAVDRLDHPVPYAADEVRAALAWSRRAADRECDLAEQLVHDLPQVTRPSSPATSTDPRSASSPIISPGSPRAQITTVCAVLLPLARQLTLGQLVARLRRLVAAFHPRHYERRYHKALRDRTVCAWLDENGTAVLCARGLSPAQARPRRADRPPGPRRPPRRASVHPRPDPRGHPRRAARRHPSPPRPRPDHHPSARPPSWQRRPTTARPRRRQPATELHPRRPGHPRRRGGRVLPHRTGDDQRVGIEVRVALSTLLGHDEQPGEIPGLGPVPASHARAVVARQHRAEWRYAITDDIGLLLFDGVTRRRPPGRTTTGPPGGIVELHVSAALLATLTNSGEDAGPAVARWASLWPTSPASTANATGATSSPPRHLPRAALAATPRSGPHLRAPAAATAPPAATRTTPSTTGTAGPPSPPTWHRCAATTTPSKGKPAGPSDNRAPARSSGPARSAVDTRSTPSPSCHRCPTPVPDPTTISMISRPHQHRIRSPCGRPTHPRRRPDGDAEPTNLDTPPPF